MPRPDLHSTRALLRDRLSSTGDALAAARSAAGSAACRNVFLSTRFDAAEAEAAQVAPDAPLAGLPVSIKDLFDARGEVTKAGSLALADAPPAAADATAVARLRAAGGVVVGRTNMTEFAFSGVGVNPHYGTP
ncbi:MAG: amidase, partial [Comamonadaceae bacterium]